MALSQVFMGQSLRFPPSVLGTNEHMSIWQHASRGRDGEAPGVPAFGYKLHRQAWEGLGGPHSQAHIGDPPWCFLPEPTAQADLILLPFISLNFINTAFFFTN